MNDAQRKILGYLADPVRTYPDEMFRDLESRGVIGKVQSQLESLDGFAKYLDENPHGYCSAGIERARIALDLKPKFKKGDMVTEKDFKYIKAGSGLFAEGKMHMVVEGNTVASQVDGKTPSYVSTATFEIRHLED